MPYADSHAYKVLSKLINHEYIWNPSIGLYLGGGDNPGVDHSDSAVDPNEMNAN